MNIYIFISLVLAFTLLLGRFVEKIRIPWIFSALFLGLLLSIHNPYVEITTSEIFVFLATLGMFFLLFIIGLELDIKELRRQGKFIAKLSFSLVAAESLLGTLFIHYVFNVDWGIAILTASSFATVGEAILIPILDEFRITQTKFGQTLLGVGTLDDVVELLTVIVASFVLGQSVGETATSISSNLFFLAILFLVPLLLQKYQSRIPHLKFKKIPPLFLFGLVVLFAFVGVGNLVQSAALGAIFAGIALRNLLSDDKIAQFESATRVVAYGFFVPMFFVYVGSEVDVRFLIASPFLIVAVILITKTTKILISYLFARKHLGVKKSILLGVGLSAKFSTSIVIITMLYANDLIPPELYSVLIGAMIASKFIIPVLFSVLISKWNLEFEEVRTTREGAVNQ